MQQRDERSGPVVQPTAAETQVRLLNAVFNAYDTVTQTLFSASLIADVLPRMWERDPQEGRDRLDELRLLTRGALAEMRGLLLELRPAAMAALDFDDLLRQLCDAVMARAGVQVRLYQEGDCELPDEVKSGLYHLAQEALHQVVGRAGGRPVSVWLDCREEGVLLKIQGEGQEAEMEAGVVEDDEARRVAASRLECCARSIGAEIRSAGHAGAGPEVVIAWQPGSWLSKTA